MLAPKEIAFPHIGDTKSFLWSGSMRANISKFIWKELLSKKTFTLVKFLQAKKQMLSYPQFYHRQQFGLPSQGN